MTGSHEAMTRAEQDVDRIIADHGQQLARMEDHTIASLRLSLGDSNARQVHRRATRDILTWILHKQTNADDLTGPEVLEELRKGSGSIYAPVLSGRADVYCHRCDRTVITDADALCPAGHELN